jgi:Zn-dependent metalloprotease
MNTTYIISKNRSKRKVGFDSYMRYCQHGFIHSLSGISNRAVYIHKAIDYLNGDINQFYYIVSSIR